MPDEQRHDPTYGQIDFDIQDAVEEMNPASVGQRVAIERTLQDRRNGGEIVLGVVPPQPPAVDPIKAAWYIEREIARRERSAS